MTINQDKKDRVEEEIKKILATRIENFPKVDHQNRNAPFHNLILSAFREQLKGINVPIPYLIAISSWLHGLSTSLGSGFENFAHILSGGYKRKFTRDFALHVTIAQANKIEQIIRELKSGIKPNLKRENQLILNLDFSADKVKALDFVVDNYLEINNSIEGIELKSVRPNSGEARGEKQKILYAKASLKLINPTKDVKYYLGFPFDPTGNSAIKFNKERFFDYLVEFKKFFSYDEVLLSSELWDHLSGEEYTMEQIFEVITKTIERVLKK